MKCKLRLGSLLIAGLVFGATPALALPILGGLWKFELFSNTTGSADRSPVGSFCFNFAAAASPFSDIGGTFSSPGVAGWNGSWIQQGDQIKIWGSIGTFATVYQGTLITADRMSGYYQHYTTGGPGGAFSGALWGQKVTTCQ